MTRHEQQSRLSNVARVDSFSRDTREFVEASMRGDGCLVRVTHASVGSTDIMARRGDYLLHPFPGFVSGYDFIGIVEFIDRPALSLGLSVGDRVAGVLPGMGAHATRLRVPSSLLVPVPDGLASEDAATLPLDGVTARHALDLLKPSPRALFINGVSGAVGLLAAQLAALDGVRVSGTASPASAALAMQYGAATFDYGDTHWPRQLLDQVGKVDGVIDHTGSRTLNSVVKRNGRIVRTAFGGPVGHQKAATAAGFAKTLVQRFAQPSEVVCSTPMYVAMKRRSYRRDLTKVLELADSGRLKPLDPVVYDVSHYREALDAAGQPASGKKVVLTFGE